MKRKIRLSALVAVMVLMLSLLIGGLYGYFSDTETSEDSVFVAGTLSLESTIDGTELYDNVTVLDGVDGMNDSVTFDTVIPGDNGTITWTLNNMGTVDGKLTLTSTVTGLENGRFDPEDDVDSDDVCELLTAVHITVQKSVNGSSVGYIVAAGGTLADLEAALDGEADEALAAGDEIVYELIWSIDGPTVGNEIQSDSVEIDIQFTLEQFNAP